MAARKKPQSDSNATPPARTPRKKPAVVPGAAVSRSPVRKKAGTAAAATAGKNLVIVESPAKAKTIQKYLGPDFEVAASYGHVRDLPRRRTPGETVAGVDIAGGWKAKYVVQDKADAKDGGKFQRRSPKEILADLKRACARAGRVFLATDPDREGEAIAWHIEDELKLDDARTFRITFNEITKGAVQKAIANPGKIDMDRVRAQEARRVLDRVVGYPLSSLLGKKVTPGLSAGRVQSVAVRLIVEREREIENFKSDEFWKITALLAPQELQVAYTADPSRAKVFAKKKGAPAKAESDGDKPADAPMLPKPPAGSFLAELAKWDGADFKVSSEANVDAVVAALDGVRHVVTKVEQKDRSEKAPPPFTTSTLQQQANIRLHFAADRTMRTAQKLYEGVELGSEGAVALITYMRTDSTRISADALQAVRGLIEQSYGGRYLPEKPNFFSSGKSAQEAHEAIRPTDLAYTPQRVATFLNHDQQRLYALIYNRFVASQMAPAVFAVTNVEVEAGRGLFKGQGKIEKFDGYRKVLQPGGKQEDTLLPALAERQALDRLDLIASQHFTQPPPRFNEASLVKALEKEGIGRPSTYATIITVIQKRGYVEQKDRRFFATEIGKVVTDLLVAHFPRVLDMKFTSHMEEELDQIERREAQYAGVLDEFWGPFHEALVAAEADMPAKRDEETGEKCPRCGKPLVVKFAKKTGNKFIGCSGYKEGCKYIQPREGEEERPEPVATDTPCPTCGKPMLQRMGQRGQFLGCSGYPECKTTMNFDAEGKPVLSARPTEHTCDKCGKPMVIREGRRGPFLACTGYPKCRNAKDVDAAGNPVKPVDTGVTCEKCGAPMTVKRGPRGSFLGCSAYPKCRSTKQVPDELKEKLKELMPAAKKPVPAVEVSETCPECGAAMKLRPGRRGFFLGCSKYPKCKGTREAPPELLEQAPASSV